MLTFLLIVLLPLVVTTQALAIETNYVGSKRCAQCHQNEYAKWHGSHHDMAMTEATAQTVLGNFNDTQIIVHGIAAHFYRKDGGFFVRTDGPDGELHDYRIRYTFGFYPLQQYLVDFPGGHVQALGLAWDSRSKEEGGQHWFHLYPDDKMNSRHRLHWTQRDQTWNYQCAECHSTNLQKNYDVGTDSYRTAFAEINVACEACHGPGAAHVKWTAQDPASRSGNNNGLVIDLATRDGGSWSFDKDAGKPRRSKPRTDHTQIEMCARCHSRRGQIWDDYEYGKPLSNTHRLALLDDQLYFPDGQIKDEVYVYGSFIQSKMYRAGVTCSDCHQPHSLKLRAEGNAVCTFCHIPERYDTSAHHHHKPGSASAACTSCHMPQRTYMVNDRRADHSMRVPRPDLSLKLGTPNACTACHEDKSAQWAAEAVLHWYPNSKHRGQHFGEALHAAATGAADAGALLLAIAGDTTQPDIARATAVERLREYAQPQDMLTIRRLLADDDPLVRAAAVRFLAVTDVSTQVDLGWTLLEDPDHVVRLDATRILAPLLRQQLPDKFRAQLNRAVEEYRQSQSVNAERAESHLNLGLIAVAIGNAREAEKEYRTAMRLEPAFTPSYVNLADLYRQQGREEEGEQVLRTGLEKSNSDAGLEYALGLLLVRAKRLDDALVYLRQAAMHAPGQPQYAYVYALALQGKGNVPQALQVLTTANEQHPGNREILTALVKLHQEQGNKEQAQRYADELGKRFH